jgi:hypothetical protein
MITHTTISTILRAKPTALMVNDIYTSVLSLIYHSALNIKRKGLNLYTAIIEGTSPVKVVKLLLQPINGTPSQNEQKLVCEGAYEILVGKVKLSGRHCATGAKSPELKTP